MEMCRHRKFVKRGQESSEAIGSPVSGKKKKKRSDLLWGGLRKRGIAIGYHGASYQSCGNLGEKKQC